MTETPAEWLEKQYQEVEKEDKTIRPAIAEERYLKEAHRPKKEK